jgi:hypothetical protein
MELGKQLNEIQGAAATVPAAAGKPARKARKFSAAGIARIRAAQKERWAKVHAAQGM